MRLSCIQAFVPFLPLPRYALRPVGLEVQAEAQGDGQIGDEEDEDANRNMVSEQSRVIVRSKAEPELEVEEAVLHKEGPTGLTAP